MKKEMRAVIIRVGEDRLGENRVVLIEQEDLYGDSGVILLFPEQVDIVCKWLQEAKRELAPPPIFTFEIGEAMTAQDEDVIHVGHLWTEQDMEAAYEGYPWTD